MICGDSFIPPRQEKLLGRKEAILKEYDQRDLTGEDEFTLGAWLHYNFECVHPFSDGNGRMGSPLLNLRLIKHNWPLANIMPADKKWYLDALNKGNMGELAPLNYYLKSIMGGSFLNNMSYMGTEADELKPLAMHVNEFPYSAKCLSLRPSRASFRP